jgi:hypothetical protein
MGDVSTWFLLPQYTWGGNYIIGSTWYSSYADSPYNCSLVDSILYPSQYPYGTKTNVTSGTYHSYITVLYDNITGFNTTCIQYEPICYPVLPENYTYNPEDIVCVGLSCFVLALPECDNDGTCDFSAGETLANCPADCTGVTPPVENIIEDTVSSISYFISLFVGSISTVLGTETVNVKGLVWFIITLVIVVIAAVKAGGLVGTLAFLGFMLIGVLVGWMPFWIGLVFILLAAFATASMATKLIKGD